MSYRFRWTVTRQEVVNSLRDGGFDDRIEAILAEYGARASHTRSMGYDAYDTLLTTDDPEVIYPLIEAFEAVGVTIRPELMALPFSEVSANPMTPRPRQARYKPS